MDQLQGIKTKAISGAIWKFLERIGAQLVSTLVAIILARLLVPDDYSIVSIITIFFTFANVFISGGFNAALIYKKNADEEDYSSVLILSMGIAFLIYAVLFLLAPWLGSLYEKPMLTAAIRIMGLILPVNALKSIISAYISSHLQFRKYFFATLGGTLISAIVGIGMAYNGFGAWALVAQQMTNTIIDTLILWLTTPIKLVLKVSIHKLKNLFNYGWRIFITSTVAVIYTEVNPLFIGLKYSGADLAFYSKGKSFPSLLSTISNNTLSAVLFPVLTKFQDDREELLRCTRRFIRTVSFIVFPAMLGFYAVADNFVLLLLTEKWLPAAQYIRIFCIGELFASVHSGNCEAIKAMGRSDIFMKMELVKKSGYFLIIGFFMLTTDTPVALAYSAIGCTVLAVIVNCIPNIHLLDYKVKYQIRDIVPNLFCAVVMCTAVRFMKIEGVSLLLELLLQMAAGVTIYIAVAALTRNENLWYILKSAKQLLMQKKNRNTVR